jgi:hypothetical protein
MNINKLKGPERMLQMMKKCKLREYKSWVLLYYEYSLEKINIFLDFLNSHYIMVAMYEQ